VAAPGINESNLLAQAAAVEANSEHPLAKAIAAEAKRRNLPPLQAAEFESMPGRGAQAQVNGKSIVIGGPRLLIEGKVTVRPEAEKLTTVWASEGKTASRRNWYSRRVRMGFYDTANGVLCHAPSCAVRRYCRENQKWWPVGAGCMGERRDQKSTPRGNIRRAATSFGRCTGALQFG
jgi:hypothetical protein